MKKFLRYCILTPIAMIYMPVFWVVTIAFTGWISLPEMYRDFFRYLKSGQPLGAFDQ